MSAVQIIEREGRLCLKFEYNKEALDMVKSLPGSRWSILDRSWSVSTRYRKRVAEVLAQIEKLFSDQETAQLGELKALDDAAELDPLPAVTGFRAYSVKGRWIVVSPYDVELVAAFKRIHGSKWNGSAWTFPSGSRDELTKLLTSQQQKRGIPTQDQVGGGGYFDNLDNEQGQVFYYR